MGQEQLLLIIERERHTDGWSDEARALFAHFVTQHHNDVLHMCRKMAGNSEISPEDLAQETWMTAWRRLHTFQGGSALKTWVMGIAKYRCMNAKSRRRELLTEDGLLECADEARSVLRTLTEEERAELLRSVCGELSTEEQDAIFLRYLHGRSYADIERMLKLTNTSGARGLLQRTRRHLEGGIRAHLEKIGHTSSFLRTAI